MIKLIKNTLLFFAAGLLSGYSAQAQADAAELTAYFEKITATVQTTLLQAADQKVSDVGAFRKLAEQNAGGDGGTAAIDIRAALYCNSCEGSPTARLYAIRIKDIIFPSTTGPTFPQDVINGLKALRESSQTDLNLKEEERARVLAVANGLANFVTMLENVHDKNPEYFDQYSTTGTSTLAKADPGKKCTSWWCRWGKCAAAIAGGAASAGLTGAIGGSAVPGIGTVAGGVIGAIGGGLTAAANFCD